MAMSQMSSDVQDFQFSELGGMFSILSRERYACSAHRAWNGRTIEFGLGGSKVLEIYASEDTN